MGDEVKRFMTEILKQGEATGRFKIHFACAREVFNMVLAALAGEQGDPGRYRDYHLRQICKEKDPAQAHVASKAHAVGQQLNVNGIKQLSSQ